MALKEDYKDAVFSGLRKYKMLDNGDGTVSPVDMTEYEENGDKFGAKDANAITKTINATGEIIADDDDGFKPEKKYVIGEIVIYDNKTWRFKVDHEPGEWDESHVEKTNILAEIAAQNKNFEAMSENNAIKILPYASNVSNYFIEFYKQGNHLWGRAVAISTVFSDKTTIKFSSDNFNGQFGGILRIFCKLPGNMLSLNENVQHVIGVGTYRFENASTFYVYSLPVVAVYNGTDTEIRVPFTTASNPTDVRYEIVVDTVL